MAETAKERYARTGDSSPETDAEAIERLGRVKAAGAPVAPDESGMTGQQRAAADDAFRKQQQEYNTATATGNTHGVEADGSDANAQAKTQYHDPGAADVGGYAHGDRDQQAMYLAGEHNNDNAQAANSAALGLSLANMKGDRGPQAAENAALVGREAASRGQQGQALDLSRQAAMGLAPSAAAGQTRQSLNDVMAGQAGAAGAAHGLNALGGVQTAGASGAGMMGSQAGMQGAMGRSNEVNSAIGMYGTQAGDMRAGDLGRVDQTNTSALANQGINDNWKIGNAGLAAKQGQLGVSQGQMDDAYFQASQDPINRQFSNDQQMQAALAGANSDSAQAQLAANRADADRTRQLAGGAVQAGLTAAGSAAGPLGTAGGSIAGGMANSYINNSRPY